MNCQRCGGLLLCRHGEPTCLNCGPVSPRPICVTNRTLKRDADAERSLSRTFEGLGDAKGDEKVEYQLEMLLEEVRE